ncbi:MAG: bifunctional precorrin-2 dehydrogenase/sirohydrochlorin ferrochelatase [Syntrophomonadaceae bacterium]|nr:bifunctional precorrin-2 dehydrogenase/sirohydrochlorin ferrochelatase [Syntrophomonadaceae bacterium]
MAHLYPIYLHLAGKRCLVVGGGKVAERKIATLLEYETDVQVVSPEVTGCIDNWAAQDLIGWRQGEFRQEDMEGVFLVFIATGDGRVNQKVTALCRDRGILVNAVDDPPNCDFYVPSILRRDSLCLAVSTEGKSPLLAAKLRRELEASIPVEYGEWVEILGSLRAEIKNSTLDLQAKKQVLEALVYSDILELLREGKKEEVEERIGECMSSLRE